MSSFNTAAMKMPAIHMRWASRDKYLPISLFGEFTGALLFQLLAGSIGDDPLRAAFTLAALMYAYKYISGGHINPVVSLATMCSGHIDYVRGLTYITAQILGGIFGALIQGWLSPNSAIGHVSPGCFAPMKDLGGWTLFLWEALLTFFFLTIVYAALFVRPGHGDLSPLAIGLALFAALSTGGEFTGFSPLNPARTLAGALVFRCYWKWAIVYISGQLTAAILASLWAIWVFGRGDFFKYHSATGSLRESLIGSSEAEPAGPIPPTFAPSGAHYAGAGGPAGGEVDVPTQRTVM